VENIDVHMNNVDDDDSSSSSEVSETYGIDFFDYSQINEICEENCVHEFKGHLNELTVKEVNYFGFNSEYVISGSDDGNIFIWDSKTGKIVNIIENADSEVVNCIQGNPMTMMLASSGIDRTVKLWSPTLDGNDIKTEERMEEIMQSNLRNVPMINRLTVPYRMIWNMLSMMDDDENNEQNCRVQ